MLGWIAYGTVLGNKFWFSFLRRFVTANHRRDSATKTIPWCNLTQRRPFLTLYLKVAYSMDKQSERECECGARGDEGGRGRVGASLTPPPVTSCSLFLLFSDPHSLVWKQRIVRLTTADIFLNNYKGFDWNVTKFSFIFFCVRELTWRVCSFLLFDEERPLVEKEHGAFPCG